VRPDAHQLLLHFGLAVHDRQVHPEREQQQLLGLYRDGNRGLSRLPADDYDRVLLHLHRVPAQHDMRLPDLLLQRGRGVRERPLHPELQKR
jgi:hypothetical protein